MQYKNKLVIASIMSLLVLIFGFGVMNLFWSMLPAYNNLPGLYYYRAATWGDGFLLPLLVGSATYYILSGSALTIKQKNRSYIMGGIAALIGILLQGSWLLNSNINLNWTIPMPHYFNIAGWYHSIFFIGIFFVISMLMTQVWYIRKNNCKGNKELYEILPYVLIWFAGSGFLFILALDDYSSVFHYMSLLLVLASVIVIGGLVFSATSIKEINLMDIACILSGIFTSLGIVIISVENINGNIWHPIATALLSITYIIQHKKILVVVIQCVLIAIPTFSINMAIVVFGLDSSIYLITLIIIAIIVPLIIAIAQKETLEQDFERGIFNKHITTGIICTTAAVVIMISRDLELIMNGAACFAIGKGVDEAIKNNFRFVIKTEEFKNTSTRILKNAMPRNIRVMSWVCMVTIGIGALITLILTLSSFLEGEQPIRDMPLNWTAINTILTVIFLISVLFLILLGHGKKNDRRKLVFPVGLLSFVAYASLAINTILIRFPYYTRITLPIVCSLFMIIGSALMIIRGFKANIIYLRDNKEDTLFKTSNAIIAIGAFASVITALFPSATIIGDQSTSILSIIPAITTIVTGYILLPTLIGRIVQFNNVLEVKVAVTKPIGGVFQDGFLTTLIVILGGIFPIYLLSLFARETMLYYFVGVGLIISHIYWLLCYCIRNNVEHYENRRDYALKAICNKPHEKFSAERQINNLSVHLTNQNILALFALIYYCFIPMIFEIWINIFSTHGEYPLKKIIMTYIPNSENHTFKEIIAIVFYKNKDKWQ